MSFVASEDASAILADFVASTDNLPSEIEHVLREIAAKEERLQDHRSKISQRDSSVQKHHKASGLLVENPKETSHISKCRTDYQKATQLADEKVLLAERAVKLVTKHMNRLNAEMARLQGMPVAPTQTYNYEAALSSSSPAPEPLRKRKALSIDTLAANAPSPLAALAAPQATPSQPQAAVVPALSAVPPATARTARPSRLSSNFLAAPQTVPLPTSRGASPNTAALPPPLKRQRTHAPQSSRHARHHADDEDAEGEDDAEGEEEAGSDVNDTLGDDTLYCLCQKVSYGEMVGCDNAACRYEWFHYDCVGLKSPPSGKWYCPECREATANANNRQDANRRRR